MKSPGDDYFTETISSGLISSMVGTGQNRNKKDINITATNRPWALDHSTIIFKEG